VSECGRFVAAHPLPKRVIFACFDDHMLSLYAAELARGATA
jgi:hypothetical protein